LGPSSADRVGTGRSRRSTARPGEPVTSGRAAAEARRDGHCDAEDPPGNPGGPDPGRDPWIRVSGMQDKLHRWRWPILAAVRRPVQLRARPGDADRGVRRVAGTPARTRPAWTVSRPPTSWKQTTGVPGFLDDLRASLKDGSFVLCLCVKVDPERSWFGETEKFRYSHHFRSGCSGRLEAGAGTDLRGRLSAGLLRFPTCVLKGEWKRCRRSLR